MIVCSIIIPLFNSEDCVANLFKTLDLFINNKMYEIILIDDNSLDKTEDLINSKLKKKKIFNLKFIKNNKNYGPAYSRNIALNIAIGKFVAFLDSDDSWHSKKMQTQVELMLEKNILFSGTNHIILKNKNYLLKDLPFRKIKAKKVTFLKALFKAPFATPSVIIDRNLINKYMFNENLRYGEDYDLWLRILRHNNAIKLDNDLTYTYKHDYISNKKSLSSNLYQMHKSNLDTFKNLLLNEEIFYYKFFIFVAFLFEFLKYYRRKIIKFYIEKI